MKLNSPAADRNKAPLALVLARVLPAEGVVLEIASGSGQHAVHFAAELPRLTFRPSDPSAEARASIESYKAASGLPNLEAPRDIDVCRSDWAEAVAAVVCINMIHIAPWPATEALFQGAARCLSLGAPLVLYGPYRFSGAFTAPSNEDFDASLRERDASWGIRDTGDIDALAVACGFLREETVEMPANNHVLVYRRVELGSEQQRKPMS